MGPDRSRRAARFAIASAMLWPVGVGAAPKRSFAVEVTPPGWRADALAQTLASDLADDQLALGSGATELAVRVRLEPNAIAYDLVPRWPSAPAPVRGSLAIGADRIALASVLRDRLHRLARTSTDATAEATAGIALPSVPAVGLALLAIALVLASP